MTFDNLIAAKLDSGSSIESLAEDFTRALNAARKQQEEKEREERELEKTREAFIDILNASIDVNSFDNKTAAAACALAYMDNQKVTKQQVEEYHRKTLEYLGGADRQQAQNTATTLTSAFKDLFDEIDKELSQASRNKSKEEDGEKIARFLRQLGV